MARVVVPLSGTVLGSTARPASLKPCIRACPRA
jgi:hypothetical protein